MSENEDLGDSVDLLSKHIVNHSVEIQFDGVHQRGNQLARSTILIASKVHKSYTPLAIWRFSIFLQTRFDYGADVGARVVIASQEGNHGLFIVDLTNYRL